MHDSWLYEFTVWFHVQDEIFDMVKPADPQLITLQDLISR